VTKLNGSAKRRGTSAEPKKAPRGITAAEQAMLSTAITDFNINLAAVFQELGRRGDGAGKALGLAIQQSIPAFAARYIEYHRVLFEQKKGGNPLHAWNAFRIARQYGVQVPPWVLSYFDKCVAGIFTSKQQNRAAPPGVAALGFRSGGKRTELSRFQADMRKVEVVERVVDLRRQRSRAKVNAIFYDVASEFGLDWSTVRDWYSQLYKKLL